VKVPAELIFWLVGSVTAPVLAAVDCDPALSTSRLYVPSKAPLLAVAVATEVADEDTEKFPELIVESSEETAD